MTFFRLNTLILFVALLLPWTSLSSLESEETLAIRRIAACYYEKDFILTKRLIEDFFEGYPSSFQHENLYVLLADVYLQEKEYEKALALYNMLQSQTLIEDSFIQSLHCHYSLKNYHLLRKAIEPTIEDLSKFSISDAETITFYYAESLFKEYPGQVDPESQDKVASLYQTLFNTALEPYAKLSLAYLFSTQQKHEVASNYFIECSQFFPDMQEKLLFLAAENQTHFDLDSSGKTFYQINQLNHAKSGDAIYNWLILLFHSSNFQEILEAKDEILQKIPTSRKVDAHLILGKTYFNQKQYKDALLHLSESLELGSMPNDQQREVIFLSALSCYHLNDEAKFKPLFAKLEKHYRSSKEYPSALFLKAKFFQQKQEYGRAQNYFNKVTKYPSSNLLGAATFESALCYFFQNNYQRAHDSFAKFLYLFNDGQYSKSATYYLLQSSSKLYTIKPTTKIKQQLINDYLLALETPSFFEDTTLPEVYLKVSKLYLDLEQFQKLFPFLNSFIERFPNEANTYQAYLLLALAHKKGDQDLEKYIRYLEKARTSKIPQCNLSTVHLHLFQAYFQQAKEHEEMNTPYSLLLEKAGSNLHQAIRLNYPVPREHFIWLTQTYFQRIENIQNISKSDPLLTETAEIMASFLEKYPTIEASQDQYLRFNYSKVLGLQGRDAERADLLIASTQQLEPSHPLHIQSLLELAQCYESLNKIDLAITMYEDIIASHSYSIPIVTFTAKLRLARLLTHSYLTKTSPALFEKICKYYQDLHISKSIKSEPIHLEAALDNALLQNIKPLNNSEYHSYLEALISLKENFLSRDNLLSKEYHEMREHYPEKNKMYEAYMMFVDAKILHLQAKINIQEKRQQKADEKISLARNLIERLQNHLEITTPYLREAALLEKEALDKEDLPFDLISSYLMREVHP